MFEAWTDPPIERFIDFSSSPASIRYSKPTASSPVLSKLPPIVTDASPSLEISAPLSPTRAPVAEPPDATKSLPISSVSSCPSSLLTDRKWSMPSECEPAARTEPIMSISMFALEPDSELDSPRRPRPPAP